MATVLEMLKAQERDLRGQISALENDLGDITAAISAIEARHGPEKSSAPEPLSDAPKGRNGMTINDAILEAVRNDAGTPMDIHRFLDKELGVQTTRNSVGTRLGKLKKAGLLDHDGNRWIVPRKNETPPAPTEGVSSSTGEATTSPNESRSGQGLLD